MLSDFRVIIVYLVAFLLRQSLAICCLFIIHAIVIYYKSFGAADENKLENND